MIIAVTNRSFCADEKAYFEQVERIAAAGPRAILLREKDLNDEDYRRYAAVCKKLCNQYQVPLIINHKINVADELKIKRIHLSMNEFKEVISESLSGKYESVGVSVHSVEEAAYAEKNGADYLIAGHIFQTDCKKGLPARGLDFLKEVCDTVSIPVYAIGGMDVDHGRKAIGVGAAGFCMMSEMMKSGHPENITSVFLEVKTR